MKKAIFSIFAVLAVFAMVMTSCDTGSNPDTGGNPDDNNLNNGDGTEYTVSFNSNGGTRASDQKVKSGGKATVPTPAPTKSYNDFGGWYKDSELTTPWNFDTDTVTADITLYAKWTLKEGYFIVTFNSNDGSNVNPQTVKSGEKAYAPAGPTKAGGYTFAGWYKEEALTTPWDFATDTVTASITLYARWVTGSVSTLVSVIADGSSLVTTTKLILTFDKAITGLTADDITLSGVSVTKGDLTNDGPVYTLPISSFTAGGDLVVQVEKADITFIGSPKTVKIMVGGDGTGLTFATAEGLKELTLSGGGLIEIDTATGIISREIANDYGNLFGVKIPDEYLPIIASDIITIKYIGTANAELTTKANTAGGGGTDLVSPDYATWTGNNTVQTKELKATQYGANLPADGYLWFQGRPNTAAWQLKILSVTVVRGADIKVTAGITGIKPVAGGTPVTTLGSPDYLQYTGTISWSPAATAFAAGTTYTATITLTKVDGYTFNGIAANALSVAGADTVTHEAGTGDTLSVTAVFPATTAAAPDKILTFADGDVKGKNTTVTILEGGNGYKAVTTAGYENAWTYFKVTFDAGLKLSDYTKISYTVKGVDGGTGSDNTGWKPGYMSVFASEATVASPADSNLVFNETPNMDTTGVGNMGTDLQRTVTVKVQPGTDLNEVWIAFRVGGSTGWTYELSNIKFYNK